LSVQLEYHYEQAEWPFNYRVIQFIQLENEILKMELKIINQSDSTMPTGLGFHPYFSRTPQSRVSAKVGKMWATDNEIMPTKLVDAPISLNSSNGIKVNDFQLDNCLIDFQQKAIIYWPEWQSKVTIIASDNCPFLVIYSPKSEDFVCLEPVTHSTDAVNLAAKGQLNTGLVSLPSNQEFSISMQIIPEAITTF
jgi:aldose 1-epimerase